MDSFSYLSVFISLILGLAVTHLLTGVAALIRSRRELRLWWPTPLWMATTFLIQVQTWWALFTLRKIEHWSFAEFLIVLLQPVAIFMMTALIIPRTVAGKTADLKNEYFREFRWFFSALLLALIASLAKNLYPDRRSSGAPQSYRAHRIYRPLNCGARVSIGTCPYNTGCCGVGAANRIHRAAIHDTFVTSAFHPKLTLGWRSCRISPVLCNEPKAHHHKHPNFAFPT